MAWRARCYECGQDVPITRPLYGKQSLFEEGDLGHATATYEAHPRRPTDTRACSAVSKTVPQYQMRQAHSTTPGEDPPQVAHEAPRLEGQGRGRWIMRLPRRAPLLLALSLLTSADSPRRVRVGVAQLISETHAPSYTERIRM